MTDENNSSYAFECFAYEKKDYELTLIILSATIGLFGLVYTFVGYRCFKAVMFLSGLTFGGTTVYVICHEERIVSHSLSLDAIIGISIGIGVLCGLITMLAIYIGLFLQGFFLGILLAIGAILALSRFYNPSSLWVPIGIIFGTGILFALFTLKWQKGFLIVGTSVMGAALLCSCIEYFIGKYSLHRYIWFSLTMNQPEESCSYFIIMLGVWPALALLGIVVQWKFTAKDYDHTDVIIRHGDRSGIRTHLVRQPRRHSSSAAAPTSQQRRHRPRPQRQAQRPQQQQSVRSTNTNRQTSPENASGDFDALPPSYDDCIKKGYGKPVTENEMNRIIRTKHGSFLTPARNSPERSSTNASSRSTSRSASGQRQRTRHVTPTNFVPGYHRRRGNNATQRLMPEGMNDD